MKVMSIKFDGLGFKVLGSGMAQIVLSSAWLRPFGIGGCKTEDVACKLVKIPAGKDLEEHKFFKFPSRFGISKLLRLKPIPTEAIESVDSAADGFTRL